MEKEIVVFKKAAQRAKGTEDLVHDLQQRIGSTKS